MRAATGERLDDIELQVLCGFVHETDAPGDVAEGMAAAFSTPLDEALHAPVVLVGSRAAMVEELEYRRERFGISYVVFMEEFLDVTVPLVAELAGR